MCLFDLCVLLYCVEMCLLGCCFVGFGLDSWLRLILYLFNSIVLVYSLDVYDCLTLYACCYCLLGYTLAVGFGLIRLVLIVLLGSFVYFVCFKCV